MALAATLIGFGLLVVALISGTLWLAVACIAVCAIGGVFLLADLLGLADVLAKRRSRRGPDEIAPVDETVTPDAIAPPGDNEVTTEFPRTEVAEPVVTLGASEPVHEAHHRHSAPTDADQGTDPDQPVRHGRHETPDAEPAAGRTPRHGSPD